MNREEVEKERIELCNFLLNESRKLEKENKELQERIDKAIEYIEHTQNYGKEKITYINGNDLLDILKGENENEK